MQKIPTLMPDGHGASLGLSDVVRALRKWPLLAIATFIAIVAMTLGIASQVTPSFDATTVLLVGSERPQEQIAQAADTTVSLAVIAESEQVVRAAIAKVGLARIMAPPRVQTRGKMLGQLLFANLDAMLHGSNHAGAENDSAYQAQATDVDRAFPRSKRNSLSRRRQTPILSTFPSGITTRW